MDRRELLQKIATFPLSAAGLADDLLAGDFKSIFKGQGIEFDEVRHYERGDDIRSIDWNASARFGRPYVKMYREERELTVFIVLDGSASMFARGLGKVTRYEQAILAAALVAFSAEKNGQRVGALFFDDDINKVYPPRKGRRHIMTIVSGTLDAQEGGGGRGSSLGKALIGAERFLKRRSLVVILSDFLSVNWEQEMGDLARKHDVIALRLSDALDRDFPNEGLIPLEDPETGIRLHAPGAFESFRSAWSQWHADRASLWESLCRRYGAAHLELSTADDPLEVLMRFFGRRLSPRGDI